MITEDYVSFETAKLLKEKGFKEWCFHCYGVAVLHNGADISFDEECDMRDNGRENEIEYVEGGRLYDYGCDNRDKDAKVWAAPTLWAAMKWLRKVHKIHIAIGYTFKADANLTDDYVSYCFGVENAKTFFYHSEDEWYNTYEEACEAAIKYCLEKI